MDPNTTKYQDTYRNNIEFFKIQLAILILLHKLLLIWAHLILLD